MEELDEILLSLGDGDGVFADTNVEPTVNSFDMNVLMRSIASNDSLVRQYHEKCAENEQIQQNLKSLNETANQIRKMYSKEKERKEQLQLENQQINAKLGQYEKDILRLENDRINSITLSKQTIAELEFNLAQSKEKHIALCETFVEQGEILQSNGLSTSLMSRKCTTIRDFLSKNGIECANNKSPSKQRKKTSANRGKVKIMQTAGTMTEPMDDVLATTKKTVTCDKSTQYQQSKATRSTCTSAFIRMNDASTNTDEVRCNENDGTRNGNKHLESLVETILDEMRTVPQHLSPIHESKSLVVQNSSSTQTSSVNYRTQGTITTINNVRKRVNYVKGRTKSTESLSDDNDAVMIVKKEDYPHPFNLMQNHIWKDDSMNSLAMLQINPQLLEVWQMLGQLLFTIVGQGNTFTDEKRSENHRLIEKMNEIQSIIMKENNEKEIGPKLDDNSAENEIEGIFSSNENNDELREDEHSRDSIESYNSGKLVISRMRNWSNCSPVLDDNCVTSYDDEHFKAIESISTVETSTNCSTASTNTDELLNVTNDTTTKSIRPTIKCKKKSINSTKVAPVSNQLIEATSKQITNAKITKSYDVQNQQTSATHSQYDQFKVPRRKSTSNNLKPAAKRKKIEVIV